jgi:hypothetical protein
MHKLFAQVFSPSFAGFLLAPTPSPALGFFLCGGWGRGGGIFPARLNKAASPTVLGTPRTPNSKISCNKIATQL